MPLEKLTEAGVTRYRYIDWQPKDLKEREGHGTVGFPLRLLLVHADRVELQQSWIFSVGHMDVFDEEPMETFAHGDERVLPLVTERFGAAIAGELARVLADANAFK